MAEVEALIRAPVLPPKIGGSQWTWADKYGQSSPRNGPLSLIYGET